MHCLFTCQSIPGNSSLAYLACLVLHVKCILFIGDYRLEFLSNCFFPWYRQKSTRASTAILQRPAMKTVGQSSNQGNKAHIQAISNQFVIASPLPKS